MKNIKILLITLIISSFASCEKDSYSKDTYQEETTDPIPTQSKRNKTNKGRPTPHV